MSKMSKWVSFIPRQWFIWQHVGPILEARSTEALVMSIWDKLAAATADLSLAGKIAARLGGAGGHHMRPLRKARKWTSRRLPSFGQILGWTCCWHRAYTPPSRQLRLRHEATALAATKMHSRPSKTGRAATFAPSARSISKLPRSARRQPVSARRTFDIWRGRRASARISNTPNAGASYAERPAQWRRHGGCGPDEKAPHSHTWGTLRAY